MGTRAIELILSDAHEYHQSGDTLKSKIGEGIMDKLDDFEEKIMQITLEFDKLLKSTNSLLSNDFEANLHGTMENLNSSSENINSMLNEGGDLRLLINNLRVLVYQLNVSFKTLPETMDNIHAVTDTLKDAEIMLLINNTAQTLDNLNVILSKIDK